MKILIVGAGIAGPTLAYWLLRAGHEPVLLEEAPALRRGGYLVDFWGAGFDVAERMGLAPKLLARGYRAEKVRQLRRDGTTITLMSPDVFVGGAGPRYVTLARSDLSAAIDASLEGRVETIFGDTVGALEQSPGQVRVTFEKTGATREFELVIGADGLHSKVRRLTFGPDEQYETPLGLWVAAFDLPGYRPREELVAKLYTEVGYQVTSFPSRDDATMFALTFLDDTKELPTSRSDQEALLHARFSSAGWETPAVLEQLPKAESIYLDRVSQIVMPSWTRGRIALVGDAASCPSLLAGQGSALAMVGAYVLAAQLQLARDDHVVAFERYVQLLAPFLRSKQRAARRLMLAFAPRNGFQLLLRNSLMRLMGVPAVANLVAGKSFRDAIVLPEIPSLRVSAA